MAFNKKGLGRCISREREYIGFTQEKMSKILGITQGHLSKIESGKVSISVNLLIKICNEFDESPDYILGWWR